MEPAFENMNNWSWFEKGVLVTVSMPAIKISTVKTSLFIFKYGNELSIEFYKWRWQMMYICVMVKKSQPTLCFSEVYW